MHTDVVTWRIISVSLEPTKRANSVVPHAYHFMTLQSNLYITACIELPELRVVLHF